MLAQAHASGAEAAFVSGSGPTVVALFAGPEGPTRARQAAAHLAGREPAARYASSVPASFARAAGEACRRFAQGGRRPSHVTITPRDVYEPN